MQNKPISILQQYWGHQAFRPKQEEIIEAVLNEEDALALLPTGGGKSICFQVPAMMRDGVCIVVTPLISLMKDQVENLRKRDIPALAVYSGMTSREVDVALDNCIYGKYKFLYLSPERLQTELFRERVKEMQVNLIAVDEAHCISEWGYDFRPAYLNIVSLRELLPGVNILALTASATSDVRKDIMDKLQFKRKNVFASSFERENLIYGVVHEESKNHKLVEVLKKVKGSAIVYAKNRRTTSRLASLLHQEGMTASFYHGGLNNQERTVRQEAWKNNRIRIMTATTAFGMGIDKPDVRLVVHYDLPESMEAYYQEAGRAGRDGNRAFALAIINNADLLDMKKRIDMQVPELEQILKVYQALGNFFQLPLNSGKDQSFDFNMQEFSRRFNLHPVKAFNCLKVLESEGYLTLSEKVFMPSRIRFEVNYQTLYQFEISHKSFDPLIKAILRSYGGAFEYYISIEERELANRADLSMKSIREQLARLKMLKMLDYIPRTETPTITYLRPRVDQSNLHINTRDLKERKTRIDKRVQAVEHYFYTSTKCRSQMLLNYFGEHIYKRCGHCDFCINGQKTLVGDAERQRIYDKIVALNREKTFTLTELVEKLDSEDKEVTLNVLRWLLANDFIKMDEQQQIIIPG